MPPRNQGLACVCLVLVATLAWVHMQTPPARDPGSHSTAETKAPSAVDQDGTVPDATRFDHRSMLVAKNDAAPERILLPDDFLKRILSADQKSVSVTLPDGSIVKGGVSSIQSDADGPRLLQGDVIVPEAGRFMFQRQTIKGVAGSMVGFIYYHKSDVAWQVRPVGDGGKPVLVKTTADQVICRAYPVVEGPQEIPPTHPTDFPVPPDENGIIQLESLPGATGVVYLDFDGEERNFESWGYYNALPPQVSNAQIFDVWKGVSEDYQPFNLNITTVRAVYDAAPEGSRIQVVVTPTTGPSSGGAGVALNGSFNWSGRIVCWSFYSSGKNAVEVISHEVGHTLGLRHHGTSSSAYYLGHIGWAPIMGAGYYQTPSQWSKGEYPDARAVTDDGLQDDLAIISGNNNDVAYRADDHGDSPAAATWLEVTAAGLVSNEGVIGTSADEDLFSFSTNGGLLNLEISNVVLHPNLDLKAEILDSNETPVASHDPADSLDALFQGLELPAGGYYLRISGVGRGDTTTGYSDYASLGAYTVTGTITGGVHSEYLPVAENTDIGEIVGTVAPRADHGEGLLAYAITAGNTDGTFVIDSSTGVITIANKALLDFESLSTRWDDPSVFELFVSITDSLDITTETIRTVVTVSDVNEAPDFPEPLPVTVAEHLSSGTPVTTVEAIDPDRMDYITYSIEAGNVGDAFSIDAATGVITASGFLEFETTSSYTLTIRATDNLTPANAVDVALTIDLLDIPEEYVPGTIIRTFYNDIAGSTVAALSNSANFPGKPHSEKILGCFDSGNSEGDSYGSAVRGYVIAPVTGNYTFWISSDDGGELRISADANPANAVVRANVPGRTDPGEWTAYPGQQTTEVALVEGHAYYIEARQKDDDEGDHVQVAWQLPGTPSLEIIPGRWLAPLQQDHAPWAADHTLVVREFADDGQRVGRVHFIEPNLGEAVSSYAITAGNESGIFTIDSGSGEISVVSGAGLFVGDVHVLTVSATDDSISQLTGYTSVTLPVLELDAQLHAWWKLDESSGTIAADSSGNSRQANLTGGGTWFQRAAANRALQLNGTNARLLYPGNNAFAGDTSFSVAAWVKVPVTHVTDSVLVQQQESGTFGDIGRYVVRVRPDGKVNFSLYGRDAHGGSENYQFDITSTGAIDDDTWHHVACVRNGAAGMVFIDGMPQAFGSGMIRQLDPSLTVAVGCDARNNNAFLKAAVDDVRFYADALGSQQIARIAGTPKVAIISPTGDSADIPAGIGMILEAVASDPDGPEPTLEWSQLSGPGVVGFGSSFSGETTAMFSDPGSYVLRVTASDGVNIAIDDVAVLAGISASSPFAGHTYGQGPAGSHFNSGVGSYTLIGASIGINSGGTADGFHMLGQSFTGDFDIQAKVTSITDVAGTTAELAGLVVRVGTTGADNEVGAFIGFDAAGSGHWIRRPTVGGANIAIDNGAQPVPAWCRIRRSGGIVEYMHSTDGDLWTTRGVTILNDEVRAGLCWSSGNVFSSGIANFTNVSGFATSNIGPLVNAGDDAQVVANLPADLAGSVSDDGSPAATTVSWSLIDGPAGIIFGNPGETTTTATCQAEGNFFLRLVANDGAIKTFDEITLTSTLLNIIGVSSTDDAAAETGQDPGSFTFTRGGSLIGDLTVDFSLTGSAENGTDYALQSLSVIIPDGISTVDLTITPEIDLAVEGSETVTLTITPGDYDITSPSAEVVIADSNHAPVWAASPITGADAQEDSPYVTPSLAGSASDPDGDPLTFEGISGPEWLVIGSDGSLSGTPLAEHAGPNSFVVRVSDAGGLFADLDFDVFVQFNNQVPAFIADPVVATHAVARIPYTGQSLTSFATDPNLVQGDVLTYSLLSGPAWLVVAPDGALGGTPLIPDLGPNEFTVRVSDIAGATADVILQIEVTETVLYLDTNGDVAGSGFSLATTWNSSAIWSAGPDGVSPTYPWVDGARAVFSAGDDALPGSVSLVGPKTIASLAVEEGDPLLNGGELILSEPDASFDITGHATIETPITGSGMGLVKRGEGTLLLAGSNAYTGDTTIEAGVLEMGPLGRLYNGAPEGVAVVTVAAGGTWRLPDFSYAALGQLAEDRARRVLDGGIIEVTGPGHSSSQNFSVTASGGTFRTTSAGEVFTLVGNATDDILIDGPLTFDATGDVIVTEVLEGSGTLTKTGPGTVELATANPLTGLVTVSAGTLRLTGSLPVAVGVTVQSSGRLTGGGSIINNVNIAGTIAPGIEVGELSTGALVLESGAVLQWQADDWISLSGNDRIIADSLDLSAATALTLELKSEALLNFSDVASTFTLVQTTTGITGFDANVFTIDPTAFPEATGHWTPRVIGNDLVLDYTPLTPFEIWQNDEFGNDAANPLIAGESADPDLDGLVNLMEYALAADPNLAGPITIVQDMENIEGVDYLRLTIQRNPNATDVVYTVQTTDDLNNPDSWSDADTFIEVDTSTELVVRDTLGGPLRFIRLRVAR